MITGEAIEKYLRDRFGESGVLVRDPDHPGWFREWNEEDTRELHQEVGEANGGEGQPPGPTGYNLKQTAKLMGVSPHTVQGWVRRAENPLPHIRDGRRFIVPSTLLEQWLREEWERTKEEAQQG